MTQDIRPDSILAAEYALGLLEGEELLAARAREASDAAFAEEIVRWQGQLAPLADDIEPHMPRAEIWAMIEDALDEEPQSAEVIELRGKLRRWQWIGGASAAAAVAALSLMVFGPQQAPAPFPQEAAPLAASIPIADTQLRLAVTYLPDREELLVSASGLTADGVHDHELWLVPQDDSPLLSLGVVVPGEERRIALQREVAQRMIAGSPLLLTREPLGGKPAGQDAGPVVAEGQLQKI